MKDKTFFFFSWEGFRLRQGASYVYTVPTDAMRAGDFSNVRNAAGNADPDLRSAHHVRPARQRACATRRQRQRDHHAHAVPGQCHSDQPHRSGGQGADATTGDAPTDRAISSPP